MKKLLFLAVLTLLVSLVPAGVAKEAAVLLQDARYAEDIEGDIDKAIGLYEQVIQDGSADAKVKAQAMYLQGMCHMKKQDEIKAQAVLSKLVAEYPEQEQIVEKAKSILAELADSDPAALMPPETLFYIEFGSPGRQIETILNMLKGTPLENPLAVLGQGGPQSGRQTGGQPAPARILNSLFNPSMMAEFKKIRGMAVGITEIKQNNPSGVLVLYPGKSDALRGLIMAGLGMASQPVEPIEGMQVLNIMDQAGVAYDDTVIIVAQPIEQLKQCINQYKGLSRKASLSDNNKSFASIGKNVRRQNAVTIWSNVDEVYENVKKAQGDELPPQMQLAETFLDPQNIDELVTCVSIEADALNFDTNINFKPGHKCLAYDFFRTPNLSRKNFSAVPSEAVALFSFAMNEASSENIDRIRKPLERFSGLDIGRGLFNNLEQVTIFVVPNLSANISGPMDIPANCVGIALTSKNPAQTRQTWETILGTVSKIGQGAAPGQGQPEGRYILPVGQSGQPVYCYLDQYENTTFLSVSGEVIKSAIAANRESKSALASGVLAEPLGKLSPSTSKLAVLNIGGLIKIADAFMTAKHNNPRNPAHMTIHKLADAFDKSYVRFQTDEKNNSLGIHVSVNNIPALKDVFADAMQLSKVNPTKKIVATMPKPGDKAVLQFSPSVKLEWTSGAGAASYKIYVGTKADELKVLTETKDNKSTLTDVKEGENYYWRVDETLADGTVITGDTWQFNTGGKLVGWWKLDGDVSDSSGNDNHGTAVNGPEFVDSAVHLDGKDDYVSLPIGKLISSLGDSTFAVWVNVDATTGYSQWQRIFDFGNDDSTYMMLTPRSERENQDMRFAIAAGGSYMDEDVTAALKTLPAARHHVAVTISTTNNTHTLYLDGKVVAKNNNTRFTPSSLGATTNNWLGRSQYSHDPYFRGSLDDFRIYNYALNDDEVLKLCQGGKGQKAMVPKVKDKEKVEEVPVIEVVVIEKAATESVAKDNLVGWWKLDGNAKDSSGRGNDGQAMNNPQWVDGKIGGALKFDGQDDYVSLPIGSVISGLNRSTIMVWVDFSNEGGAWQRIFDFGTDVGNYIYLSPRTDVIGPMRVAITAGEGEWVEVDADSGTLPSGWHHVAVVLEPGNMHLYLDGKVVASTEGWYVLSDLGSTTNNWLGRSQYTSDAYFNGSMDDFRIYNKALTGTQIAEIYKSALNQ